MRTVRSTDTDPERRLRAILRDLGIGFRTQARDLPGSPDAAVDGSRIAIFVHGCFWHGHTGCGRASLPKSHKRFWSSKIALNRRRDAAAIRRLRRVGFHVLTIWGCQLKDKERVKNRIAAAVRKATPASPDFPASSPQ